MTGIRDERIPIDPEGVRKLVDRIAEAIALQQLSALRQVRPIVTVCPICRRPNPCPLHLFGEQCDHRRATETQ